MGGRRAAWLGSLALGSVVVLVAGCVPPTTEPPPPDAPRAVELVSVATSGEQSNAATQFTPPPRVSDDGRYVVFQSDASNLVADDDNSALDVFVRDRETGTTRLVSAAIGGGSGGGPSRSPGISGDGRFVVFDSAAPDLVPGDGNGAYDVFVRDLEAGTTERVSVDAAGDEAEGSVFVGWVNPISDDGSKVVFSTAEAFVPDDTNEDRDVYMRDRTAGTTTRVSLGPGGGQIDGYSQGGTISGDGTTVAFETGADGLVPGDQNGYHDIFVNDLDTQVVELVSADGSGQTLGSDAEWASLSDDGRYVAFGSYAALVAADGDLSKDVFRRDRLQSSTQLVSFDPDGLSTGIYERSELSDDGSRIVFQALDAGPDLTDVLLRNLAAGSTIRLSGTPDGSDSNGASFAAATNGDGSVTAFWSDASDLVVGDANGFRDVFVSAPETGTDE